MAHLTTQPKSARTILPRAVWWLAEKATRAGAHYGITALEYHPLQMWRYHQMARRDADRVAEALLRTFPEAQTYVDVGAGSGAHAAALKRRGRRSLAYEYSWAGRFMGRTQGVPVERFDLADRGVTPPAGLADVACCYEVAEHLPERQGLRLVETLARIARLSVFTAAPPGQGGVGHVNEQPQEYWVAQFDRTGSRYEPELTVGLRHAFSAAGVEAPWFFENLMVFSRPESRS